MTTRNLPLEERFMLYISPEPNTGCWLWTGMIDKKNYGHINVVDGGIWRCRLAHRVSWELFVGPIPAGQCCLHHCDQPSCSNPAHLFIGTRKANAADMAKKWRGHKSKTGLPFGVGFDGRGRNPSYNASVSVDGKQKYLGSYATPEEASAVAIAFKNTLYAKGNDND